MNKIPQNIDHLVYTASTLDEGIDAIEKILGVRAIIGGKHPQYGTHNALLSLGDSIYLEIIAPDPNLESPMDGRLLEDSYSKDPKLTTWVLREKHIDTLRNSAVNYGIPLGQVETGQREKPDGSILKWQLSNPYAFPMGGAIPFLINWGNSPHPAQNLPKAGKLIELQIEHPEANELRQMLLHLNVDIRITQSEKIRIEAKIQTENGIAILD